MSDGLVAPHAAPKDGMTRSDELIRTRAMQRYSLKLNSTRAAAIVRVPMPP